MSDVATLPRGLSLLLQSLIDYAGLFPPAGLSMADAVARFVGYRSSPDAWALGRFVVPASRLEEFEEVAQGTRPAPPEPPLPLTVLAALPLDPDMARVIEFGRRCAAPGAGCRARVESLEVKVTSADDIRQASTAVPADIELFFEVPVGAPVDDLCRAAASAGRGVKLRTGGVTVDAFPPSTVVARFLAACAAEHVPFKATAGLHHPFRSVHPVTYEPGAPGATMHGFVNLFVAAALLLAGEADVAAAIQVLEDEMPRSFEFDEAGLGWRGRRLGLAEVAAARRCARGFGSCSFEEPLTELGPRP